MKSVRLLPPLALLAVGCTGTIHEPQGNPFLAADSGPALVDGVSAADDGPTNDAGTDTPLAPDTPVTPDGTVVPPDAAVTPDGAVTDDGSIPDTTVTPDEGGTPDTTVVPPDAGTDTDSATGTDAASDTGTQPDTPAVVELPPAPTFACNAASAAPSPLRRLSRRQLRNALADSLAWALGSSIDADAVMTAVAPLAAAIPPDSGAERLDLTVNNPHVDAHYLLAEGVAQEITSSPARIGAVFGSCATDGNSGNVYGCVDAAIGSLGLRLFRRPVPGGLHAYLLDQVYAAAADHDEGLEHVLTAMFASPFFVWQVELGGAASGAPETYALTAHELAARLSFHFWDTSPDEELLATANGNALVDDQTVYDEQVARLANDPRTVQTIRRFFGEWLDVDHLAAGRDPHSAMVTPGYAEFAGADAPSPGLIDAMVDEVLDMSEHIVFAENGTLDDILVDDRSFATDAELANLYGVATWNGSGAPPFFAEPERAGLIARGLFLANAHWRNTIVRKGNYVYERLMCGNVGLPPDGAEGTPSPLTPPYTERERLDSIQVGSCYGCHVIINPWGEVTEQFDALGRMRSDGTEFAWFDGAASYLPVDSATNMQLSLYADTPFDTVRPASEALADSGRVHHCFSRHYFRFAFARNEDLAEDACTLEAVRAALYAGTPVRDVFAQIALQPAFKLRRVGSQTAP